MTAWERPARRAASHAAVNRETALHTDPGLQPERTSLAWSRTVVSCCAASAILLRFAGHFGAAVFLLLSVLVVGCAAILVSQRVRYRRHSLGLQRSRVSAQVVPVGLFTALLVIFGCGAVILTLRS